MIVVPADGAFDSDDAEVLNLDGVRWRHGDAFAAFAKPRTNYTGAHGEPAFPQDEVERLLADFAFVQGEGKAA